MATIAFLGLGNMGSRMARRLLDAGHGLTVWNRTAERATALADAGASVAGSPAEAGSDAEIAITMLTGPEALEAVVFGERGLAESFGEGRTLIEMSTVGPDAIRSLAERLAAEVVDAPVLGSIAEASEGLLHVLVGANPETFERVRPILETLGSVRRVGERGAGAAMKLVANATLGAAISAVGEALALADALGLERSTVFDVLIEGSHLRSIVGSKRESIESTTYPPRFKLSLARKDLDLVTRAAGRPLPVVEASRRWFETAEAEGAGEEDYSAVVEAILEGGSGASSRG
jgi:3-hydroxyisobutyrate dehydrogenase-like beta-hydroxyacid dehydrogenase